jgi:hypothetical protein
MKGKPILCVDFDGVIHSYERGWADGSIYGSVTEGFWPWLAKADKHFNIVIYSSRSATPEGIAAMAAFLAREAPPGYAVPSVEFADKKPPAFVTIDDRCVRFDGSWEELDPIVLRGFKPWMNRREA